MTFLPNPLRLKPDEVVRYVMNLDKSKLTWNPVGITWHNAGAPNLTQWAKYPEFVKEVWGKNYDFYCRVTNGWHSGPHGMGTPDGWAFILCDLLANGVHCSCFNHDHFGEETVGDFSRGADDPLSGPGLAAMQSSANTIAAICAWLNFDPDKAINFHRECIADHHSCPGNLVADEWAKGLVKARLAEIKGLPAPAPLAMPTVVAGVPTDDNELGAWIQSFLNKRGDKLYVDGQIGPASERAIANYLVKNATASV